ncbi:MAG TPA: hypothetical protein VKE40_01730 [Gemmataceae bacterium]|nr:hypothetical protein [Gemmataceae bacterium]
MRRGLPTIPALLLAVVFALPAAADEIHRNDFSGKTTHFIKGDDNVKAEEKAHDLSTDRSRSLPTSEHIKLNLQAGKKEANYAYYYYPTPPAPLTEDLSAELWVHSNVAGVQLLARVVFPKIRNPKQIDESLTRVVLFDTYKAPAGGWQKLVLKRPADLLQAQKQALRLDLKGDPDVTDAYIDRLILNLYTGPGEVEVFLDNLEIGPVGAVAPRMDQPAPPKVKEKGPARTERGVAVDFARGRLTVGGVPMFPRFIRYAGTPLGALRDAGFNGLYMPVDTPSAVLEDAIDNYQFWLIPGIPPVSETNPDRPDQPLTARDAEALVAAIRKFRSGDGVLAWDLGPVRSEDYRRVSRTVEAIRAADPRRPVSADVWDGFGRFAIPLQLVGIHREPLFTTLDLDRYGQWMTQRRILASGARFTWAWVQTQIPEWQMRLLYDRTPAEGCAEPFGPQPEQIRLLTYLALAAGSKGLGFTADPYMADPRLGRERLLQLALLNHEIEMLEPLLHNLTGDVLWVTSSNPSVKVAILRTTSRGMLAMPIWLGGGAQYVAPQAAVQGLTFTVPLVPDGAEPWEITPVRVHSLQYQMRITAEGTQITLPEFDQTAAVVFTSDNAPDGLLAAWQRKVHELGPAAAAWACELAEEEFKKVMRTQARLEELAPPIETAGLWLRESEKRLREAQRARVSHNEEFAYLEAIRSLRPLRLLMRAQWEQAVRTLDYPGATPYSVSFYTLPRHWELARALQSATVGENALPDGDFEAARPTDRRGIPVTTLRGWTVQEVALDDVVMSARLVPSAEAVEKLPEKKRTRAPQYEPTSPLHRPEIVPPQPTLGETILKLTVAPKPVSVPVKKKEEKPPPEPQALERVFLAVNSPAVRFPPGTWVRITCWVRVLPGPMMTVNGVPTQTGIRASADGAMVFDTTAGEAYAARIPDPTSWRKLHLYRKVPESGEVRVRLALTGFGTVYFDDVRVEPYLGSELKLPTEMLGMPKAK